MLKRTKELVEKPGFYAEIIVKDGYIGYHINRETIHFDTLSELEEFHRKISMYERYEEHTKYLKNFIHDSDEFEHMNMYEIDENGKKWELKWG